MPILCTCPCTQLAEPVEIYFSMMQRKVLTPNDFADLQEVELRLRLYEDLSNRTPRPFNWRFTKLDLFKWLQRQASKKQPAGPPRPERRDRYARGFFGSMQPYSYL